MRCVKADQLAVEGMDWLATDLPSARALEVTPKGGTRELNTPLSGIVEKDLA